MINTTNGTPAVAYVSLVNGAIGPTALSLFTLMGQAAVTLDPKERFYVTSITISSNDTAGTPLVTVDTGTDATHATPTKLARAYVGASNAPPFTTGFPPGTCRGDHGVMPRAAASAVTAGKTVEVLLVGYVSKL